MSTTENVQETGSGKYANLPQPEMNEVKMFKVPVDSEHKSKVLRIWSFSAPHHLSFQLNWMSFFLAFFATFAVPPLIPVIRDNLDLTKQELSGAAIASVTGAIFSRIALGVVCDSFGPRYGHGVLQLLTSTATFCMAAVDNSAGFIVVRMFIGFSLATFVSCQFWCSVMFNVKIVGTANAVAGGWGNAGAGFTHLIMPYIYEGMTKSQPAFIAWRCAFFIPAFAQILIGLAILLFGQDLPDGNYAEMKKSGQMSKPKAGNNTLAALKNYRTWILVLTYGYCFGVELTVDNNIAPYLHDQFNLDLELASVLGSVFSLSNIFARALGGIASDIAARRFGMRGRLWVLYTTQSLGGVCSILMYTARDSLGFTMAIVACWSIFVPMACGATFGVVPFITRRGLGAASGFVGAGGNAGGAITQAIFFTSASMTAAEGFQWMGVMILAVTAAVAGIHFPMWGSMFFKGNPSKTEDDYYLSDYTDKEKTEGAHRAILNFINESKSQRGFKSLMNEEGENPSKHGSKTEIDV